MCKPKPGPRCGPDTRKDLARARQNLKNALRKQGDAEKDLEQSEGRGLDAARSRLNTVRGMVSRAFDRLETAERDWDSTPEGQDYLAAQIESAESDRDRELLQARLAQAQETRRTQNNCHRLRLRHERVMQAADPAVVAAEEEHEASKEAFTTAFKTANATQNEIRRTQSEVDTQVNQLRDRLKSMAPFHQEIHDQSKQAFIDAGVDPATAEHYAADTVASMQSGWHYLSPDVHDRSARFLDAPTVKTKGEGHEDHERTHRAAENLAHSERFQAAVAACRSLHSEYSGSLETLPALRERVRSLQERGSEEIQAAEQARADYRAAAIRRSTVVASAAFERQKHDVNAGTFYAKAFIDPQDGSTNAFVLTHIPTTDIPVYARVLNRDRDSDGPFLLLETGEKIRPDALQQPGRLALVKPASQTRPLFSR